ncbi:MAG: NADH-dependent peroxiredoxin subunit, partial [Patescibacteria group bacterium]|nr:NADH-dependent peroxiredoxin subunit [Patescibacteria group bacterium]
MNYDLIIIGGGPAGSAAAVYAARKKLKTLFITSEWGGQSIVSEQIYNWIGTPSISGNDLALGLKSHVMANVGDSLEV